MLFSDKRKLGRKVKNVCQKYKNKLYRPRIGERGAGASPMPDGSAESVGHCGKSAAIQAYFEKKYENPLVK